ncbi:DUF4234 domain-containing protein [Clostridium sp. CF012]|uniref:DUF4234 domain-containing protein n=1 Tax=Clostridium sp. CF012 TaxID=2843319 RepID=UPI001C0C4097|nr:DUF4234 domain-containing protein [Clostridium sp. CF012]MBU3144086.1 DUF4234 domain-containing protein [Clostridium sp. CF012]
MAGIFRIYLIDFIRAKCRQQQHMYWMYVTTNELNQYLSEEDTSGGMVLVFSSITCGIYALYWYYNMGKKLQTAQCGALGKSIENSNGNDDSILYHLLSVFGFSIVASAIIQSNLNKVWGTI